jgi:hypothetical protein
MQLRFLSLLLLLLFFCQCKKSSTGTETLTPPSSLEKVKREHGQLLGTAVKQAIGAAGGTITAADGGLTLSIPAGAVETTTAFSIQPVENTLQAKGKAYRLLPEGTVFKKPVTLTYNYASAGIRPEETAYLFLAYQDAAGYYYQPKNLQHNAAAKTLTVQTTHFSDWTFSTRVDLQVDRAPYNGALELLKSESVKLTLVKYIADEKRPDAYNDSAPLLADLGFDLMAQVSWTKTSGSGTLTAEGTKTTYKAPPSISTEEELLVTATVNDADLGKDNNGQIIRQMILSQPVRLLPDGDFFDVTEDGNTYHLKNPKVSFVPGFVTVRGDYPNGNSVTLTVRGAAGAGSYVYGGGESGKAAIEYIEMGSVMLVQFRPDNCATPQEIHYSPGAVTFSKLAAAVGEYSEGSFTGEVYDAAMWCTSGKQKILSGKFKVRKDY